MSNRSSHLSVTTRTLDLDTACKTSPRGLDYYGTSLPASNIGGDFFDFLPFDDGQLLAAAGDVFPQGVASPILVSGLQSSLRTVATQYPDDLAGIVRHLNRNLWQIAPDDFYATLFIVCIDPGARRLHYVSAAHETALLVRKDGRRIHRLDGTGPVLGLSERSAYQTRSMVMEEGDVLLAFTDGVAQATDNQGRLFGADCLIEAVRNHRDRPAAELVYGVLDALYHFTDYTSQDDDRTLLVARLKAASHKAPLKERATLALAAA